MFGLSAAAFADVTYPAGCSPEPTVSTVSSVAGTQWLWLTTREADGNGAFCAKEASGTFIKGTVSRMSNGVATFSIDSCTPVQDCTNLTPGTRIYGLEVENLGLIVQPVLDAEKQPIVSLLAGTCPTQSLVGTTGVSGNFVINQWFPGVSLTSSTQVAFGKFLYDTSSTPVLKATTLHRITDLVSLGVPTINLNTGTCAGDGDVSIGGVSDTGDMKGKLYFGPPFYNGSQWTQAFTYRTSAGNTYFGTPDVAIGSRADLNGNYSGFSYNMSSTGRASVKPVTLSVNLAGTAATGSAYADAWANTTGGTFEDGGSARTFTIPTTGQTLNSITYNSGIGCGSGGINCPTNGMISGQISDGTNNRNMTCGVILNTGRPFLNCVSQGLTTAATPTNMLLALVRPLPGSADTRQPFGCPCVGGLRQTWDASSNGCISLPSDASCETGTYSGMVSTDITTGSDNAWGVAVAPETPSSPRRIVVAGICSPSSSETNDAGFVSAGSTTEGCVAAYTLDGMLDTSFSANGHRWEHGSRSANAAWQTSYMNLITQSDGKIIALGTVNIAKSEQDWIIARYTTSGTLDTTFKDTANMSGDNSYSANGIAYLNFQAVSSEGARDALIEPSNGNIAITGYTETALGFALVSSTGDLVAKSQISPGSAANAGLAVVRQELTGGVIKYIVAGYASNNGSSGRNMLLARFTSAGVLDSSTASGNVPFGPTVGDSSISNNCTASSTANGNGTNCTDLRFFEPTTSEDTALDLTFDPQGRIIVVGSKEFSGTNIQLARFSANGVIDTSFDSDGMYTHSEGFQPSAVHVQPDGKILVTGGAASNFRVLRFQIDPASGAVSLDTSFNAQGTKPGLVDIPMYSNVNARTGSAILPDGRILMVGSTGSFFQMLRLWW